MQMGQEDTPPLLSIHHQIGREEGFGRVFGVLRYDDGGSVIAWMAVVVVTLLHSIVIHVQATIAFLLEPVRFNMLNNENGDQNEYDQCKEHHDHSSNIVARVRGTESQTRIESTVCIECYVDD